MPQTSDPQPRILRYLEPAPSQESERLLSRRVARTSDWDSENLPRRMDDRDAAYLSEISGNVYLWASDEELEAMRRQDPRIVAAELDLPFDAFAPQPDPADMEGYSTWGLDSMKVHQVPETGRGVRVGVIDTGMDFNHPDLQNKAFAWANFASATASAQDGNSHGTAVAGLIAGGVATEGRYSVAPNVSLAIAKISFGGSIQSLQKIDDAIRWAAGRECRVINLSFGRDISRASSAWNYRQLALQLLHDDVLLVASAGNGSDRRANCFASVEQPADAEAVLAVGAILPDGQVTNDSARGQNPNGGEINLVAPGSRCKTCRLTTLGGVNLYRAFNRTSAAAPYVSGLAALLIERSPAIKALQLWDQLLQRAAEIGLPRVDGGSGLAQAL